jgi:hypothetical protein
MKKKTNLGYWLIFSIILIIILNIILFTNNETKDEYSPYLEKVVLNDLKLREIASDIIKNCDSGDKNCQIIKVYNYITKNFNYYSDPRDQELIQSPSETLQIKGGDCEDLTILTISLLENIGIKTYIVFTENHAYALACGIEKNTINNYLYKDLLEKSVIELNKEGLNIKKEEDNIFMYYTEKTKFSLDSNKIYYYGGNGEELTSPFIGLNILYEIDSSKPINFYVIPSKEEFEEYSNGNNFKYYKECIEKNLYEKDDSCNNLNQYGGIMIENLNDEEAEINLELEFQFKINPNEIIEKPEFYYYTLSNENCIVLETTAGELGYVGFNPNSDDEKIAIDPLTKEKFYLE